MATRDNGLVAGRYVELTELDPRVADTMLAALRAAGIAAYAEPSRGRSGPNVETLLPRRPLDRLWVDAGRVQQARTLIREQEAGTRGFAGAGNVPDLSTTPSATTAAESEAEAWARIVVMFDDVVTDPVPRWPVSEDIGDEPPGDDDLVSGHRILRRGDASAWTQRSSDDEAAYGDEDGVEIDRDDHFVPPPPPPLPKPQLATKRALAAIAAGILLILAPKIWPSDFPPSAMFLGVISILGGIVALVMGMREGRSGNGPDDGAVV